MLIKIFIYFIKFTVNILKKIFFKNKVKIAIICFFFKIINILDFLKLKSSSISKNKNKTFFSQNINLM